MKNVLRAISVFLFVFLIMTFRSTVISAFDSGDGTSTNPYVIKTPGEMDDISDELDAYYVLGNDIDMTGYNLRPIGTYNAPFTGVLDGAGFLISNLSTRTVLIDYSAGDFPNAYTMAMFGVVSGSAEIYNLGLNINYVFNDSVISGEEVCGDFMVGGLVGLVDSSDVSIHDVWITGSIDVTSDKPKNFVSIGGLIGEAYYQTIFDISFSADITVNLGAFLGNELEGLGIGGILGYASNTNLTYSSVTGSTFSISSSTEVDSVGGLVGYAYIDDMNNDIISYSVVDYLTIDSSSNNTVGGVVGYVYNESGHDDHIYKNWVRNTTFTDGISLGGIAGYALGVYIVQNQVDSLTIGSEDSPTYGYAGGVVGEGYDLNLNRNRIVSLNITAGEDSRPIGGVAGYLETSFISYTYVNGDLKSGYEGVGGIVGEIGYVEPSDSEVNITNTFFDGTLTGYNAVGGIVGYAYNQTLFIGECWSLGSIVATSNSAGGLVGYSEFNKLSIENSYSLADVSGPEYIGGLVGGLDVTDVTIYRAYFAGEVSGDDYDALIGNENSFEIYTALLFFDEINGLSDYGSAVPTADLKSASSEVGLAFEAQDQSTDSSLESPWFVISLANDGYLGVLAGRYAIVFIDQDAFAGLQMSWGEMISDEPSLNRMGLASQSNPASFISYSFYWGLRAIKPNDPSRAGYVFEGWYTEPEFTNPWDFNQETDGDKTLYAKWTAGIPGTGDMAGLSNALLGIGSLLIMATKRRKF